MPRQVVIYLIEGHEVPRCGRASLNSGYITPEVVYVYILPFTKFCRSPAEATTHIPVVRGCTRLLAMPFSCQTTRMMDWRFFMCNNKGYFRVCTSQTFSAPLLLNSLA